MVGRAIKGLIASLAVVGVAFVAVTWWALEADGVAIVQTSSLDGSSRFTHVWYVQQGGDVLLEAGTTESGWFVDVQHNPDLWMLEPNELAGRYTVEVFANPEGHERIRSLLRDKYGWRYRWIGIVFDTSRSTAVRLVVPGSSQ